MALFVGGCALGGGGSGFRLPEGDPPPDSLVTWINSQALSTGSVKGSGKLRVVTPEYPGGRQLDMSLVARRPDLVRMRGRVGILASIFDFLADADSLHFYLPRDHVELAQANVPGADLMSIVASRELVEAILPPPIVIGGAAGDIMLEKGKDAWIVTRTRTLNGAPRLHRSVYDAERLKLVEMSIRPAGAAVDSPEVMITYDRHAWTGQAWFPGRIRLELPGETRSVTLTFETFEPNPATSPDVFTWSVPAGTRRLSPEEMTDDFLRSAPDAE
ncbi:MAG TPA: hypothetical protein VF720_11955 [Candidatus Eisenbacteria bacterium]